ncbi:MAG TPA: hypothetical protein VGX45_12100 [Solirubrobacteraceae bacterium]|nr:hypothetical protein [Solirubrobacteraceae bacterium]
MTRFATAHLSEIERLDAFGSSGVWRPIRHHFGIEGFGINAYTANEAGQRVIEEHEEVTAAGTGGRHQELYIVISGRATFTLDGETRDAPAGTFVFIGEPDVRRGAVAAEPDTTVLAIGARPGVAFTVSPWEWSFRALAVGGAEGLRILDEGDERFPGNVSLLYNRACLHALGDDRDGALAALAAAIEADPRARGWAREDQDFASLRDAPEFVRLTADARTPGTA